MTIKMTCRSHDMMHTFFQYPKHKKADKLQNEIITYHTDFRACLCFVFPIGWGRCCFSLVDAMIVRWLICARIFRCVFSTYAVLTIYVTIECAIELLVMEILSHRYYAVIFHQLFHAQDCHVLGWLVNGIWWQNPETILNL